MLQDTRADALSSLCFGLQVRHTYDIVNRNGKTTATVVFAEVRVGYSSNASGANLMRRTFYSIEV